MASSKQIDLSFKIQTEEWVPKKVEPWPLKKNIKIGKNNLNVDDFHKPIRKYCKDKKWVFPKKNVHFISDIHADADALIKSLIGAGFISKTGPEDVDFELTNIGKTERVIIGGDCLDKGPSNLRLLDVIYLLKKAGLNLEILAGNHDIRTYAGLSLGEERRVIEQHMFVRMGKKTIPLFREIYKKYIHKKLDPASLLSEKEVEKRLFPTQKWFDNYAKKMEGLIPPKKIEKETVRIQEKIEQIRSYMKRTGFTHGMLYATVEKARDLFLYEKGEYAWFFRDMKIAIREGSFLFVHAGLDDFSTDWIGQVGVKGLNEKFKILMRNDPFELYNGHIGNIFRTKYRDTEFPFSSPSVKKLNHLGINAIIHGHRNVIKGHRITIKKGILNFECDTSLDRVTRKVENLDGVGAGWFTLKPNGTITAFSTDYPKIKKFDVKKLGGGIIKKLPKKKERDGFHEDFYNKKSNLNISTFIPKNEVGSIFENLANDFNNGELLIANENDTLSARLPENLEVEINSGNNKAEGKIEIVIKWKHNN